MECKLDEDAKSQCEGPVTYNECERDLSMMKSNKSPGLDVITTEFYKTFWPILGNLLDQVFNESHEFETLSESQRKAVMSFVFKKDDDEDISNYRPISLTNVDYRILAFTLAQRMQKVVSNMIGTDQTAYIKKKVYGYKYKTGK